MRTIYVDSEFKCHAGDDGTLMPVETDFFDGKCNSFIEGYRLIPEGCTLAQEDGTEIRGLTIFPWKEYSVLAAYQEQYEVMATEMADMQNALAVLGVEADG